MSALTDDRNTPMRDGAVLSVPAAGGKRFYAGAMAAISSKGFAVPGSSKDSCATGAGRVESNVDNTAGQDGDCVIAIRKGIFRYDNDGENPVSRANIGFNCYILDDQTVRKGLYTASGIPRPIAGQVFDVDCDGVWIKFS